MNLRERFRSAGLFRWRHLWGGVWFLLISAWLGVGTAALVGAGLETRGLVVRDGAVQWEGRPFRGIGANYFSLFSRLLQNPDDTSSLSNLPALARAEVPFVRFMCGGYWPSEQRLYLEHREEFLRRLGRVVRSAEKSRIGLIPSLFWHLPTCPDLVGEPMQALGDPRSHSIALLRRYTEDVVRRHRDSPAIWAWEFGNESALAADLPNAREHRPPVAPALGTPAARDARDEIESAWLRVAAVAFGETVRRLDPARLIISGNALPRESAWHNSHEKSWTPDTADQFCEILLRDNPDPMNVLSIHLYRNSASNYPGGTHSLDAIVALAAQCAQRAGKPLFVGEFGAERSLGSLEKQKAAFTEFLAALERHRVPLAAFWVFDYPTMDRDWNVSFQNDRAALLDLVTQANRRLRPGPR